MPVGRHSATAAVQGRCNGVPYPTLFEMSGPTTLDDRADPQAHDRAFDIAHRDTPSDIPSKAAVVVIAEVLESIGDTCPECPPD